MQNPPRSKSINSLKSKTKSRISKRQRNRRRNKQRLLNCNQNKASIHFPLTRNIQRNGADIWRDAYENAVRWHCEHQGNYWRRAAENLQRENQMLRQQLQHVSTADVYYETSDDDEEEDKKLISVKKEEKDVHDEVDMEYLEFLQITLKHREELRLKRRAEAQEVVESPAPPESPT